MIQHLLSQESIEALGWTLLHSLWQGAFFAIFLVLLLILLRSYSAQSRYLVSVGLLCAFFLTVSVTFTQQWQVANHQIEYNDQTISEPSNEVKTLTQNVESSMPNVEQGESIIPIVKDRSAINQFNLIASFKDYYDRHLPLLVTIWLMGILFLQLRFLGQLAYVQRLKHYGTQLFPESWKEKIEVLEEKLRIQKKVSYLTSTRTDSPMVIGWLKPVVLMPQRLLTSLTETEIYAVLAHELAHIRREDFIVNLLQTFLCNVFFFHPGVWWMSHRIDDEREHCCDDLAVQATGPATSYAKTLINVSELQLKNQQNLELVMGFSGKSKNRERGGFSARVKRLFKVSNGAGSFREGFATACILMTALILAVAATGPAVQSSNPADDLEPNITDVKASDVNSGLASESTSFETPRIETELNPLTTPNSELNKGSKNVFQENRNSEENIVSNLKNIISTTITTGTWQDDLPISINQEYKNLDELPIAEPEEISRVTNVDYSSETRIDALIMACKEGDFDFVKTLVDSGINVNSIGSKGFTPLMTAVNENEFKIVEYLLSKGAKVNQTINGWTALIEAADEDALESMKLLLKAGADVNYFWTMDAPTAITMAASEGHLDCLKLLLENGADINGVGNSIPPLHIASAEGQDHIVDYLLSNGVDVNGRDANGSTALMFAYSEDQTKVINKLIKKGADVNLIDDRGNKARDYGEEDDSFYANEVSGQVSNKAIHEATRNGLIERVIEMVAEGTDVNSQDEVGRTPLHIAAALNHNIDMLELINLDADLNATDGQGRTPLMYAAADGKAEAVALLVSRRANINLKDVDGMTAYDWAKSGGNSELIQFLGLISEDKTRNKILEKRRKEELKKFNRQQLGDDENYKDPHPKVHIDIQTHTNTHEHVDNGKHHYTLNHETVHIDDDGMHLHQYDIEDQTNQLFEVIHHESVVALASLLTDELTVNTSDETGQTPLMVAARVNRIDMAKFLIKNGANVNLSSASGLTALHYAALENHYEFAKLLLDNNAEVDPTMRYSSTDGNYTDEPLVWEYIRATPLLIAVESSHTEVVSILLDAGANIHFTLRKNEYLLKSNRRSYLTQSEVMGIDNDFLKEVDVKVSDHTWTPYKQAELSNNQEILALFKN